METLLWEHFRVFLAVSEGEEAEIATESAAKVRMANDFMHGHYDEPLTVETIAMSVGASARSLQSAFRRVTGQTPWERLTAIRLEAVRHRLLSPQDTGNVTAVAMNSGFSHLGRFAALYRKTYGERPSETLARKLRK
ncbi:helix-turn-helix transcriptional regulator [Salipiger sp. CCB-MM3]|uniref:helix-turn-helix transcriptional regulator n=1 Tax=Salipiger sp. CCB-MM3 TaxID=1792508 RepID=UPI0012FCAE76|nr:helix-turn-helix transcriptional regulator [Salipiger sp. CCB-MM3]